jgi:hypothetical protein
METSRFENHPPVVFPCSDYRLLLFDVNMFLKFVVSTVKNQHLLLFMLRCGVVFIVLAIVLSKIRLNTPAFHVT